MARKTMVGLIFIIYHVFIVNCVVTLVLLNLFLVAEPSVYFLRFTLFTILTRFFLEHYRVNSTKQCKTQQKKLKDLFRFCLTFLSVFLPLTGRFNSWRVLSGQERIDKSYYLSLYNVFFFLKINQANQGRIFFQPIEMGFIPNPRLLIFLELPTVVVVTFMT